MLLAVTPFVELSAGRVVASTGISVGTGAFFQWVTALVIPANQAIRPRVSSGVAAATQLAALIGAYVFLPEKWMQTFEGNFHNGAGLAYLDQGKLKIGRLDSQAWTPLSPSSGNTMTFSLLGGRF